MKAYESFLRRAGTPIGIVGAIMLAAWGIVGLFNLPANEDSWTTQCERLAVGNTIIVEDEKMGDQHFCVVLTPMEDYPPRQAESTWKDGCRALGGTYRAISYAFTCYTEEVFEELGARETYGGTP